MFVKHSLKTTSRERCGYTCGLVLFSLGFVCTAVGSAYCLNVILRVLGGVFVSLGGLLTMAGIAVCILLRRNSAKEHFIDDHNCQGGHDGTLPRQHVASKYINQQHLQQELLMEQPGQQGEGGTGNSMEQQQQMYCQMTSEVYQLQARGDSEEDMELGRRDDGRGVEEGRGGCYEGSLSRGQASSSVLGSYMGGSFPQTTIPGPQGVLPSQGVSSKAPLPHMSQSEKRRAAYAHHHHASAPQQHPKPLSYSLASSSAAFSTEHGGYVKAGPCTSASAPGSASGTPQHPCRGGVGRGKAYLQAEKQRHPSAQPLILQPPDVAMDDSVPPSYDSSSFYSPRHT